MTERLLPTTSPAPADPVSAAERELRTALADVTALDAQLDDLSERLDSFSRRHDAELQAPYDAVDKAERLVRRIRALADVLRALSESLAKPPPRARRKAKSRRQAPPPPPRDEPPPEEDEDSEPLTADEDDERALKRLLRRLARVLHPDLAQEEHERARLHELMTQVNAAYELGDRIALEVMAEKVGAGEPVGELTAEERLAHLERRTAVLKQSARSLKLELERLRATDTFRLFTEAETATRTGRDYFADTRRDLEHDEQAALRDGWARLLALSSQVGALNEQRERTMGALTRRKRSSAALRSFDPMAESPLVRVAVERLERRRATHEARTLARELEETAQSRPWEVALTLLAYYCELAVRPPDSLETPERFRERYDALRAEWPEAPTFDRLLAHLPPHLEVGLRRGPAHLQGGVQLRSAELVPGVTLALDAEPVADLARQVLAALGPRETCKACRRDVTLQHLYVTRGLDEVHGLACPACFALQRRYFVLSRLEGLEALAPHALKLGLLSEQVVKLAGASIAFQFPSAARARLTAKALAQRFVETYLVPYKVELPEDAVYLHRGREPLRGRDVVPSGPVTLKVDKRAELKARELLELLRSRIERRFR